jgi:hypothetical protein
VTSLGAGGGLFIDERPLTLRLRASAYSFAAEDLTFDRGREAPSAEVPGT